MPETARARAPARIRRARLLVRWRAVASIVPAVAGGLLTLALGIASLPLVVLAVLVAVVTVRLPLDLLDRRLMRRWHGAAD